MAGGFDAEVPERGYSFLGDSVRRRGPFDRAEVERAVLRYFELARRGTTTGDWDPWVDLFTEDAIYVEHSFGVMRGREAIRGWVKAVTGARPSPLEIEAQLTLIENDLCVIYTPNRLPAPDGGGPYQFVGLSVFCYAGDGMWCYEEDVTNSGEIQRVNAAYTSARTGAES